MQNLKNKILIVEDEPNLGNTLHEYLMAKGHACELARSAKEAQNLFQSFIPQIVLMDIGLPDGNGLKLAKQLRDKRRDFVLLFLSALNDPESKLEGLELGAEDYITKPFALKELTLRLERILSYTQSQREYYQYGPLKIWFKRYELVDAQGITIPISQKECGILKLLVERKGEVISRDEIIERIWGEDQFPSNRTVDNYIVKLRKWTETDEKEHLKISSIRGIGYRLEIKEVI